MSVLKGLIRRATAQATVLVRDYAEANMIAKVHITRRGDELVFDSELGVAKPGEDEIIWDGDARVYTVQGPITTSYGDEPQHYSQTMISIPLSAKQPRVDDVVLVTLHPDLNLIGRYFRVIDVESGGQLPHCYRLQVTGIQPSRDWSKPEDA